MITLSYTQLRKILGLALENETIKTKLGELISGKAADITEMDMINLVNKSEVDMQMIEILSGKNPAEIDAVEGLQYITDFFAYCASNKATFSTLLAGTGLKAQTNPKASKRSK